MGLTNKNIFGGFTDQNAIPQNIKTKSIKKIFNINDKPCTFILEDAWYGEINGDEILLDEQLVDSMIKDLIRAFVNNSSKYNSIPNQVIISRESVKQYKLIENEENANKSINENLISKIIPRWTMDDVYMDQDSQRQIMAALSMLKHKTKLFEEWGLQDIVKGDRAIVLNFYGPPGTGKSMAAEAIANQLNKHIYHVNYSELESKYVGETPKNISKIFSMAKENDAVIVFDEADSFLGKRLTNVSQSADYGVNITRSVMLLEIERYDGIIVFTTNMINNYDEAFKRRIFASVEFKMPDELGRIKIWSKHLPNRLPVEDGITAESLGKRYVELSGADIKDIVLYASLNCLQDQREKITFEDFDSAAKYIRNRYATSFLKIEREVITEKQYKEEISKYKNEVQV